MVIKKMKKINKKAIVFTILALVISSFILIMFFYLMELPLDHKVDVTRTKIHTVNTFLSQSENIAKAQGIATSRQAINHLLKASYQENKFIEDFEEQFKNCLETGTFTFETTENRNCEDANLKEKIETDLTNFLKTNTGIKPEFNISNIELTQFDNPWELIIKFNMNIQIKEEFFHWNVSYDIKQPFSIEGLKDPIQVAVHEDLKDYRPEFEEIITIEYNTQFKNITNDWTERPSTLNNITMDKKYFENTHSISYLNRLKGNLSKNYLGITRIQPTLYDEDNIIRSGSSNLDWHYWQDQYDDGLSYGIYNFTRTQDKILVLDVPADHDLKNTIHKAIMPKYIAHQANASSETYFYEIN